MKCFDGTAELGIVLYGDIFKGGGRDVLVCALLWRGDGGDGWMGMGMHRGRYF